MNGSRSAVRTAAGRTTVNGRKVVTLLKRFVDEELLACTRVTPGRFWSGLAELLARLGPLNRHLLAVRESMQTAIDAAYAAADSTRTERAMR